MKVTVKKFLHLAKCGKLSIDHKRNLRVLVVASLLNFSFAIEKFFLSICCPLPDWVWMVTYGGLGIFLTLIAFHDYVYDLFEDNDHESYRDV